MKRGSHWAQVKKVTKHWDVSSLVRLTTDDASPGLLVESLHIPLLTYLQRSVHKHLKERQAAVLVEAACLLTILWTWHITNIHLPVITCIHRVSLEQYTCTSNKVINYEIEFGNIHYMPHV